MNEIENKSVNLPQKSAPVRALQNPITVISGVGGGVVVIVGIVAGSFWIGFGGMMLLGAAINIFLLLTVYFGISSLIARQKYAYAKKYKLKPLEKDLKRYGSRGAAKQLTNLMDAFSHFKQRLEDRIGTSAEEYPQYLEPAEEMYQAAIYNLESIARLRKDIAAVRVGDAKVEIARLKNVGGDHTEEIALREKHLKIAKESAQKVEELKVEVDRAVTTLLEVSNQLNDIVTNKEEVLKSVENARERFFKVADINRRINDKVRNAWNMMS